MTTMMVMDCAVCDGHGLISRAGQEALAACAACNGTGQVLTRPSSDAAAAEPSIVEQLRQAARWYNAEEAEEPQILELLRKAANELERLQTGGAFSLQSPSSEMLDATRYRFLRNVAGQADREEDGPIVCRGLGDAFTFLRGVEVDRAVDAAIRLYRSGAELDPQRLVEFDQTLGDFPPSSGGDRRPALQIAESGAIATATRTTGDGTPA